MQNNPQDCGIACVNMILRFYSLFMNREKIERKTNFGEVGISLKSLVDFFIYTGANPELAVINDLSLFNSYNKSLLNKSLPAIVLLDNEETIKHYVVVWKVGRKKTLISDPSHTKKEWIKNNEISKKTITYVFIEKPDKISLTSIPRQTENLYSEFIKHNLYLFALITFFSAIVSILSAVISFNLGANISILQSNFSVSDKNIRLIAMMVLFVFLGILQIIINYFKTVFIIKGTVKFETHLFEKYLDKILSIHSKYFRLNFVGEFSSRINDILQISSDIMSFFVNTLLNVLIYIFSMIILYHYSKVISFYLCVVSCLITIFFIVIYPKLYRYGYSIAKANTELQTEIIAFLDGIEGFKSLSAENFLKNKASKKITKFMNSSKELQMFGAKSNIFISFLNIVGSILLIAIGAILVLDNKISLANLTIIVSLSGMITSALNQFGTYQSQYESMQVAEHRLQSILFNMKNENNSGEITLKNKIETIKLCNVSIWKRNTPIINSANLTIFENKNMYLSGENGSGKSTIVKTLVRLEDDYQGEILINDINIKKIDLKSLRSKIIYIEPEPNFSDGTLKENLFLGNPVPEDILKKMLQDFEINEILNILPNGLDFPASYALKTFSSGQRQKISLFRGILKKPDILIIDEVFSNMDIGYVNRILPKFEEWNIHLIIIDHSNRTFKNMNHFDINNGLIKKIGG